MTEVKTSQLLQALDQRIRTVVEEVIVEMLASGPADDFAARARRSRARFSNRVLRVLEPGERPARRGRPRGTPRKQLEGKIVRTVASPKGPVIYTKNDKYLRQPDGSLLKLSRVKGSFEPARAMGYSSAEYQVARRHRWPMPCPMDFVPHRNGASGKRSRRG